MKLSLAASSAALIALAATPLLSQAADKPVKAEASMQKVLDTLASLGGKPIETLTPEEARKQPTPAGAVKKLLAQMGKSSAPDPAVTKKTMSIAGPLGNFPIHVFTPAGAGPFPVMMYYHGGGFVIADTAVYEASPRALAKMANAVIVSVDYHRAPEHKFPAAPNDAYAAYEWVLANAKQINGDATRVAVGGESAGGNLATVVSMMARDKKAAMPVHQLLVYPVVNNDMNTPSYQQHAAAKPLNKPMMEWFFKHYGGDPANPYALPMKATSLAGLPPATVITAEIDPLLSEGKAYADRLRKDGVKVDYKEYKGMAHEFFGMGAVVPAALDAEQYAAKALKSAFMVKKK
ncbi:MAG: alpha/beta hydrolase [Pseudomonadota bacterium]